MIEGVIVKHLKFICDERGRLAELLRKDDEFYKKFGQVYVTTVYPGVVKAWHYHKKQTDNIIAIKGMIKLVLYDPRRDSKTKDEINEFFIGEYNLVRVIIPPLVLHGFKCISSEEAFVINVPDYLYNYKRPDEYRIGPYDDNIPYDWRRKDG
ncbi:MAG: dTDP-4-dehydrorhamnose 3,5-epimerase family protein [Candidatus Hydrogenedentota bacterium]